MRSMLRAKTFAEILRMFVETNSNSGVASKGVSDRHTTGGSNIDSIDLPEGIRR
jgi:hypothetical protein